MYQGTMLGEDGSKPPPGTTREEVRPADTPRYCPPRSGCQSEARPTVHVCEKENIHFKRWLPQRSILQGHLVRVRSLTDPVVLSLLTQEM